MLHSILNMNHRIRKKFSSAPLWITLALMISPVMPLAASSFSDVLPDFLISRTTVDSPMPQPYHSEKMLEKGKFLVASRNMKDPRFSETVILLVDYSQNGAMGLIINRPTKVKLSSILPDKEALKRRSDVVYYGGPVNRNQICLIIKSVSKPEESVHVIGNIYVSSSQKVLDRVIGNQGKGIKFHAHIGYSGWGSRQLEREITMGGWQIVQADPSIIFNKKPSEIWHDLINRSSGQWVRRIRNFWG